MAAGSLPAHDAHDGILELARLDILAPNEDKLDPGTFADQGEQDITASLCAKHNQRPHIFYDENVTTLVILQCPYASETAFTSLLDRCELTMDTVALGTPRHRPADDNSQPPVPIKDAVDSQTFRANASPIISVRKPKTRGEADEGAVMATWRREVHISRLRIRSQDPSVYFTASLKATVLEENASADEQDEFMEPMVPEAINLLESLRLDPALRKNGPILTAARLAKVLPKHKGELGDSRTVRSTSRHLFRLIPAINTRARFARIGASPTQTRIFAFVDIDITPHCPEPVLIRSLDAVLSDGRAEPLATSGLDLPSIQHSRDALTVGYNLLPNHQGGSSAPPSTVHTLSLLIQATLSGKRLKIAWRYPVDLSPLHARPTIVAPQSLAASTSRPSTATSTRERSISNPSTTVANHLVTLTVSGPPQVRVHETLRWSLLIANRSSTRTLRIALIPITSTTSLPTETISRAQKQAYAIARRGHRNTLSTSLFRAGVDAAALVAQPVGTEEQMGLIPLTADIRLAPLLPGQCATAEMRFLVLRAGALKVEAVRIVDLDGEGDADDWTEGAGVEGGGKKPRRWVDVGSRYLPDVVGVHDEAHEAEQEGE